MNYISLQNLKAHTFKTFIHELSESRANAEKFCILDNEILDLAEKEIFTHREYLRNLGNLHILENLDKKKIDSYIEKFENEIRKLNLDSQTNNLEMSINQCFQTGMLFILDESYSSLRKRLDEFICFVATRQIS